MKGKKVRKKGKLKLSDYFKKFEEGESVAIVKELGVRAAFPTRIVGKSGKIKGSRGRYQIVELKDGNKTKTFIIHPVHLKKLK
jgi:large subunit ribosomal protein L21e